MSRRMIARLAYAMFCWITVPAHAAQILCAPGSFHQFCPSGVLTGPIVKGDYERVVTLLRANHPNLVQFYLISPGGDVDEALKIGRLFRKYLISTMAPQRLPNGGTLTVFGCRGDCGSCASACALIWFGGVERNGSVGVHRPRTDDPTFASLSPANASIQYRKILASITAP